MGNPLSLIVGLHGYRGYLENIPPVRLDLSTPYDVTQRRDRNLETTPVQTSRVDSGVSHYHPNSLKILFQGGPDYVLNQVNQPQQ